MSLSALDTDAAAVSCVTRQCSFRSLASCTAGRANPAPGAATVCAKELAECRPLHCAFPQADNIPADFPFQYTLQALLNKDQTTDVILNYTKGKHRKQATTNKRTRTQGKKGTQSTNDTYVTDISTHKLTHTANAHRNRTETTSCSDTVQQLALPNSSPQL